MYTLLLHGCSELQCGPGTEKKQDETGRPVCVAASATSIPCNLDGGARVVGGACEGDPGQFPSCGTGTKLDPLTGSCVADLPDGGVLPTTCLPPPCLPGDADPNAGTFCVVGAVRYLKNDACTAGKAFEVRAYDPLAFIFDPANAKPLKIVMTDANGAFKLGGLKDESGQKLIAIGVVDPGGAEFVLSGSGARDVTPGNTYRVDLYPIEKTMVAAWDQQAGLGGMDTFEAKGGYLARFFSDAEYKVPVAGAKLVFTGQPAQNVFHFKGDLLTLDKSLVQTDAATGSVLQRVTPSALGPYTGQGGGVANWETIPGASVPGVIFVQKFRPMM